jgi:hypothetical protein
MNPNLLTIGMLAHRNQLSTHQVIYIVNRLDLQEVSRANLVRLFNLDQERLIANEARRIAARRAESMDVTVGGGRCERLNASETGH